MLKHLMDSSVSIFEPRLPDVFATLHSRLKVETSNRVRKMMAQLVAIFGRLGQLSQDDPRSLDFIEFIVKLCALPPSKDSNEATRQGIKSGFILGHLARNPRFVNVTRC